jgi:hypothetical protein
MHEKSWAKGPVLESNKHSHFRRSIGLSKQEQNTNNIVGDFVWRRQTHQRFSQKLTPAFRGKPFGTPGPLARIVPPRTRVRDRPARALGYGKRSTISATVAQPDGVIGATAGGGLAVRAERHRKDHGIRAGDMIAVPAESRVSCRSRLDAAAGRAATPMRWRACPEWCHRTTSWWCARVKPKSSAARQ